MKFITSGENSYAIGTKCLTKFSQRNTRKFFINFRHNNKRKCTIQVRIIPSTQGVILVRNVSFLLSHMTRKKFACKPVRILCAIVVGSMTTRSPQIHELQLVIEKKNHQVSQDNPITKQYCR